LGSVTLPAILSLGGDDPVPDRFRERSAGSSQEATFLLDRLFRRTSRLLAGALDPAPRKETDYYTESGQAYTAKKERVVEEALERWQFRSVLDIGGNIGRFSVLAARHGASVVAIDRDPDAAGMLWRTANRDGLDILALVIDIARPPGACGWANAEFPSFLDRARGKFDCVLMLALIHHLLINERVPPEKIFELVAELTTNVAIVEYIDRTDLQFQRIARGRAALHGDFTRDSFEAAARSHFKILESWEVSPTRRIYTLQKSPD
jgi:SAM-dependent methyltransferase